MSHYLGIDIGGTNIVCGAVDEAGRLIGMRKLATEASRGSADVVSRIADAAEQLRRETLGEGRWTAAGIGVPGFVDHERGVVELAVNLGWEGFPLAEELAGRIGAPVHINNDVRMYVYGEAMAGAGKGVSHVYGITLGTGMAGALVQEGELFYGGGGIAGEIGHIPVPGVSFRCNCGLTGCLETVASANGLARQARQAMEEGRQTVLSEWFPGEEAGRLTAADVTRAWDAGDVLAQEIMDRTGRALAVGLTAAITLYSPQMLVIGGGAARAGERLLAPMREELQRLLLPAYWNQLGIRTAELLEEAGVVGSAIYAKRRAERS